MKTYISTPYPICNLLLSIEVFILFTLNKKNEASSSEIIGD